MLQPITSLEVHICLIAGLSKEKDYEDTIHIR